MIKFCQEDITINGIKCLLKVNKNFTNKVVIRYFVIKSTRLISA